MRKKILFITCLILLFCLASILVPSIKLGLTQNNLEESLLLSSESPNGQYTIEAYRTEPGATVDFSIKVYLIENEKVLIYNAYHEYEAEILWITNSKVSINGKILDLTKKEKYDWRLESS